MKKKEKDSRNLAKDLAGLEDRRIFEAHMKRLEEDWIIQKQEEEADSLD